MKILLPILTLLFSYSWAYSNQDSNNTEIHTNLNLQFARAIDAENLTAVKELVALGVEVNHPEIAFYLGRTSLHQAVFLGNVPLTRFLIDVNADVHALNNAKRTPLYSAAFNGDETILRMLLEASADPLHTDSYERTAAFWADQNEDFRIVDILNRAANGENVN